MNTATSNQQPMSFSQGRAATVSPEERHRRRRQRQINPSTGKTKAVEPWKDFHSLKRWNLIPQDMFKNKGIYFSMMFDYPTFTARYTHFQHYCHFFIKNHKFPTNPDFLNIYNQMEQEAKEKYMLNQKLRWAFKRLAVKYLQTKLQVKNEVDPVSLEEPKQSVYVYDYATRSKFAFEAQHLLRDFQTRLLTHDELFPSPLNLRNPLTNEKLKMGQTIHVLSQIKKFGLSHWTIECYLDAQFCIALFLRDNNRKLRLHALKETLNNPLLATEIILDFIEMQHVIYNKHFDERTYQWALQNNKCHTMERIRSWKALTYRFYELDITQEDYNERVVIWKKNIALLQHLCSPCIELLEIRRSFGRPKPQIVQLLLDRRD